MSNGKDAARGEQNKQLVVSPARLPWTQTIETEYGIKAQGWKVLVEATYPAAKTANAVLLVLSYCAQRGLDPFKRPVHIVPMWDNKSNSYIETIWPGIAELRTTASRTKSYAGCDHVVFGPSITKTFEGEVMEWENGRKQRVTKTVEVTFPEWAYMTVYRIVQGVRCAFVGPIVYWMESYATIGKSDIPNDMWQSRPCGQLEKNAEAGALRRAFPEELGSLYAAEEMDGRIHEGSDIKPPPVMIQEQVSPLAPKDDGPPIIIIDRSSMEAKPTKAPEMTVKPPVKEAVVEQDDGPPMIDLNVTVPIAAVAKKKVTKEEGNLWDAVVPDPDHPKTNPLGFLAWADKYLAGITTAPDLEPAFYGKIADQSTDMPDAYHTQVWPILEKHMRRLGVPME